MDYNYLAELLFPNVKETPEQLEEKYPARDLPEGAKVTRFAPSPTGFVHFGGMFPVTVGERTPTQSARSRARLRLLSRLLPITESISTRARSAAEISELTAPTVRASAQIYITFTPKSSSVTDAPTPCSLPTRS